MAFDTLTSTLFQVLADVEDFSYTSEELQELYDKVKPTKKGHKKPMKTSAYKMFQAENAGKPEKPNWKDIKEDPDKFKIYQDLASKKNEELGFSNEQDAKNLQRIANEGPTWENLDLKERQEIIDRLGKKLAWPEIKADEGSPPWEVPRFIGHRGAGKTFREG